MILVQTKSFIRDINKLRMNDKHFTNFIEYLYLLSQNKMLPSEARDHALIGEWMDFRECHIGLEITVIYTDLDTGERRIISAWRAEPHEKRAYWRNISTF